MEIKEVRPVDIARRLRKESNDSFFSWVKLVVTLSSGILSILIAFKNNYVPENPQFLIILSLGFSLYVVTIFSGLVILHSEAQTKLDAANNILDILGTKGEQEAIKDINKRNGQTISRPIYLWSQYIFHVAFGLSFACVVGFVLLNS